jgi:hypothetical protein
MPLNRPGCKPPENMTGRGVLVSLADHKLARMARLKKSIAEGSYCVPARSVAEAFIIRALIGWPSRGPRYHA